MKLPVAVKCKENAKDAIVAIGQELIKRAEDITNDLEMIGNITIFAQITQGEIANFDITKNYIAMLDKEEEK